MSQSFYVVSQVGLFLLNGCTHRASAVRVQYWSHTSLIATSCVFIQSMVHWFGLRFGGFMGATWRGNATAGWIYYARAGRWPSVYFHPELKLLLIVCRKSPQLLCKYSTSTGWWFRT